MLDEAENGDRTDSVDLPGFREMAEEEVEISENGVVRLVWMCACTCIAVAFMAAMPELVSDFLADVAIGEGVPDLDDRVNPNVATWVSLARLPGIGEARAAAIVAYRKDHRDSTNPSGPVFTAGNDLRKVKGIGAVTAEEAREWLKYALP